SSPPDRVLILNRSDRVHGMCAPDGLHSGFRKSEVLDLTFPNQILHRAGHIFNRDIGIDTMLIEQIDHVCPESFQRSLSNFFDVLWSTVYADLLAFGTDLESELGGDHHSLAHWSQCFADELFIREWAVNFSRVKERDASFHRCSQKRNHLLLILRWAIARAHSHAAKADRRDFEIALAEFALVHFPKSLRKAGTHELTSYFLIFTSYFLHHSELSEAISIAKRYFTSDLSSLRHSSWWAHAERSVHRRQCCPSIQHK